jgi:sRNA-binding protein
VHEMAEAEYDFALEEQEREYREQQHREAQRELERERRLRAAMYEGGARAVSRAGAMPVAVAGVRRGAPLRSAPRATQKVVHTKVADLDTP